MRAFSISMCEGLIWPHALRPAMWPVRSRPHGPEAWRPSATRSIAGSSIKSMVRSDVIWNVTVVTTGIRQGCTMIQIGTPMKKLSFAVSLTNNDNDYQQEQAAAAEKAGRRLGVDVKIIHANNDAVTQSQQLLHLIQGPAATRPDAIVFEPAGGTGFPQVARAAVAADIGWVILNHQADYIEQLRLNFHVPVFSISSDHTEVGQIQGKQLAALLPKGGSVLYIEGPANSSAAKERSAGMHQTKPASIPVKSMR